MECQYYKVLLSLQAKGEITEIILQPHMQIIAAFEKYGKKHRKAQYTPDFLCYYKDGSHKYIEVKGFSKPDADLRRKLFDSQYPDELIWVTGVDCVKGVYTRWVFYDDLKKERSERRKAKAASAADKKKAKGCTVAPKKPKTKPKKAKEETK